MKVEMKSVEENLREISDHAKNKFGITVTYAENGTATGEIDITEAHTNAYEIAFGGVVFNLADIMAGVAFISAGCFGPTISGTIDYMNGAKAGKKLVCTSEVTKQGRHISFVKSTLTDEDGRPVAGATFSFYNTVAADEGNSRR